MKRSILSLVMALCLCLALIPAQAFGAADAVKITKTSVKADSVMNTEGYGSLKINGATTTENGHIVEIAPQVALMDRTGKMLFPYKSSYFRYYVSEGIVSFTGGAYNTYYVNGDLDNSEKPEFYNLDGTKAFSTNCSGAYQMSEGYAFAIESTSVYDMEIVGPCLLNSRGEKVYSFGGNFTKLAGYGGGDYSEGVSGYDNAGLYRDGLLFCWSYPNPNEYCEGELSALFYMNTAGQKVLSLPMDKYSSAQAFSGGYAAVKSVSTGKWGFVDKTGKEVIPCIYDATNQGFKDGLVDACKDGKWGYIDEKGNIVIPFEYAAAYGAGDGLAAVVKNGKCGLVDYNNNIVVPFEYDDISTYEGGVAYAIKGGNVCIITGYTAGTAADAPSAWAKAEVESAISTGMVPGNLQKNYTKPVVRANVAQLFINLIEKSKGKSIDEVMAEKGVTVDSTVFSDTTDEAVLAANALGIIGGIGNGKFNPNGTLTRAQIAAIINRVAKVMDIDTEGYNHGFTDVSGHWVSSELGWPSSEGIITGVGNNKFNPNGELTTEQTILITYRALQVLAEE